MVVFAPLLLAAGWALRLHQLGRQELWFDEAASYFIASMPVHDIVRYVTGAVFEHPPLYYVLLHYCIALFGSTEWALRFPSAVFGLLFVAGMWRLAAALDRRLPPWAAALAATSAFMVTYSQEARMYALLQCLGLLSTYLLYCSWRAGRPLTYGAYAATMLVGILTHYFFAFLFVAHACMALAFGGRRVRAWRYVVLGASLLAVTLAAWLASAAGLRQALAQVWRESLWGKSPQAIAGLARDWAFGGAIITERQAWEWLPTMLSLVLAALGLAYGGTERRLRLALALWVVVPVACAIVLPYGGLALRHFSYIAPPLLLLTAAGLLCLRRTPVVALGVAAIAAATVPGLLRAYALDKGQYGRALAEVATHARPNDALVLANPHQWVLANYYDRTGLERHYVGDGRKLPSLAGGGTGQQRIWLVEWETWALSDWGDVLAELRQSTFEGQATTYSVDMSLRLLYVSPDTPATATAGSVRWDATRDARSVRIWADQCQPGDAALVEIDWEAPPSPADTAVVLRLLDAEGHTWAEASSQPLGLPDDAGLQQTSGGVSRHALVVPGGTPPGNYTLQLGVVDLATGAQLAAAGGDGVALGPWLTLASIRVAVGAYPAPDTDQAAQEMAHVTFVGGETDVGRLTAGDRWSGIVQFRARESGTPVALSLALAGLGREWDLGTLPLAAGSLPAEQWPPGTTWRCLIEVRLPTDLPPGQYRLLAREPGVTAAGLLDKLFRRNSATLDTFAVSPREPHTVPATPDHDLDVVFAGQVRLEGYDLEREGDALALRLYWQAIGPTAEAQKAFVHLAAPGVGEPLAQDDAYPATVPTCDWLAGDRFVSEHRLATPDLVGGAGYVLRVGLYSERTMARLPASGVDAVNDHVEIPINLP